LGRAGRDGLPAEALLFFSYADVQTYREMFEQSEGSEEQKQLKIAKLNRMFQVAEAPVCRRRTILNYFNEVYDQNCGNCDVCQHPPQHFDGTLAAQKALSAILRTGEKVGMTLLVDILRGSQRREILEGHFHEIKTYGAGKEYSYDEWLFLLSQMLHHGYIEIAYDDFSHLRVTDAGKSVLFEGKRVKLALPKPDVKKAPTERQPVLQSKSPTQSLREALFERLVALRRLTAQKQGVPPYLIFSDATLKEMVEKQPLSDTELLMVSGVGERKLQLYGDAFIGEIRKFVLEKKEEGVNIKGSTQLVTLDLYKKGQSVAEIAEARGISPNSVMAHLVTMYERGETIDIHQWVGPEEMDLIQGALSLFETPYMLKPIFDHFEGRFNYDAIRWALAHYQKHQT
jgi:ATP-dependent DNA helicase RecQ